MGVYYCAHCGGLVAIDEINCPDRSEWVCGCDATHEWLLEVVNFEEFLKELGYVGENELVLYREYEREKTKK
jgi:hypothetical protein